MRTDCGGWRRGKRPETRKDEIFRGLLQVTLAENRVREKATLEGAAGSRDVGKNGKNGVPTAEGEKLAEEKRLALCHPIRGKPLHSPSPSPTTWPTWLLSA